MDRSESVESEKSKISQSSEGQKRITRRKFLNVSAVAVAAAAVAAVPEVGKLLNESEDSKDVIPTYEELVSSVNRLYSSIGQEIPGNISQRLLNCNENNLSPSQKDPVKTVLHSCGKVGGAVRNLYRERKLDSFKDVLHQIEIYTYAKMDKFAAEGKLPDPENIESFKNQFKEAYFTP